MAAWYCNFGDGATTGYYGVAQWQQYTAYAVGNIVRQQATPTSGSERCFRCTTAGTSLVAEPAWTLTKASTTTETGGPVWTEITGNSTYNWSAPHAKLTNAISWMAAGDDCYIGHNHAETALTISAMTFQSNTTFSRVICVNTAGSIPPISADLRNTASITATSGVATLNISQSVYFYGITFSCSGSSINLQSGSVTKAIYENCNFILAGTATIISSTTTSEIELINSKMAFTNANNTITLSGSLIWRGQQSSISGTVPTKLFNCASATTTCLLDGVDLSLMTTTLVNDGSGTTPFILQNCKLGSAAFLTAVSSSGAYVNVLNSDSGTKNYRIEKYSFAGTQTAEITNVLSNGATDGTTPISYKIVTTSGANWQTPYQSLDIASWVDTAATHTATFEILSNNAILTNADIWVEASYLSNASFPQSSVSSTGLANVLANRTQLTASTATWTTTGVTTPIQQKAVVTFVTAMKGPVRFKIKVAAPSQTIWVNPFPTIT